MNRFLNREDIVATKEIPGIVYLGLRKDWIVEEIWDEGNSEVTEEHVYLTKDLLGELGGRKKLRVFVTTQDFMSITPEGRKATTSVEANEYTLAAAVLIDNLAKKLLFNFFLAVSKQVVPTKGFTTKDDAIAWLLSMK